MRVLVTGANGFVGARLSERLRARGDEVSGFDRELDVSDAPRVVEAVRAAQPEALVHLAALSFVPAGEADPALAFRVNFLGARSVLDAVRYHEPHTRVLLVGSGAVYGDAKPGAAPFDEASPLRPTTSYAWTKAAADRLGGVFAARGLSIVRVRPFSHSGPGRPDRFVESSFARQIAERELGRAQGPLRVGNLDALRDFLDVEDVIDAYLRLLDPAVPAGVYNVASGTPRRIGALLDTLRAKARVSFEVERDDARWRPADAMLGDATRLREATGWQPLVDFEDTLTRLLEHWRAELSA